MIKPETSRRLAEVGFISHPKPADTWSLDLEDLLLEINQMGWEVNLTVTEKSSRLMVIKKGDCFVTNGQKEEITNLVGQMYLTLKSKARER